MTSLPILPEPDAEALAHSQQLAAEIRTEIDNAGGWIDFARYMHLALYEPGLGYYSGGAKKFGRAGDFVTAPEISLLFAQTLARQAAQVLQLTQGDILELGAGTGQLAIELLLELHKLGRLPERYLILEVSAQLRELQRTNLQQTLPPALMQRMQWLDKLPEAFSGLILGNEVLDALPVHVVKTDAGQGYELGVTCNGQGFTWGQQALSAGQLSEQTAKLSLPATYTTELCPAATGLIVSLSQVLQQGVMLFIDYGFPRREYYHPQRDHGTLMCHYRHYAHDDPFLHPGLQDITAHVDFTAIAEAGVANDMLLLGYCGQAQFLINCGITEILTRVSPQDMAAYAPLASQAHKLLSPAEMGELFKVIALGKDLPEQLLGFARGDKRHSL